MQTLLSKKRKNKDQLQPLTLLVKFEKRGNSFGTFCSSDRKPLSSISQKLYYIVLDSRLVDILVILLSIGRVVLFNEKKNTSHTTIPHFFRGETGTSFFFWSS